MNWLTNKIIILITLSLLFAGVNPVFSLDGEANNVEIDEKINLIYQSYRTILKKRKWTVLIEGNRMRAYRFGMEYNEMTVEMKNTYEKPFYKITVSIFRDDKKWMREFRLKESVVTDNKKFKDTVLPFLLRPLFKLNDSKRKKIFFAGVSMGYNRTHDNKEFYPEKRQGSFYTALTLEYDPGRHVTEPELEMNMGDYLYFNMYMAIDSEIRENFYEIDFLVYGKNTYKKTSSGEVRSLYGFFNGFDYFRPGFDDPTLTWTRQLYHKQPHIQYIIWRALQFNYKLFYKNSSLYSVSFMIGAGPSINSSIIAAGLTKKEEEQLDPIFKSLGQWTQNYYYSVAAPARIDLLADNVNGFKFGIGYYICPFFPIEDDVAYEILQIPKFSIGYYFTSTLLFDTHYEYWHIRSRLEEERRTHHWNRLVIELKYLF